MQMLTKNSFVVSCRLFPVSFLNTKRIVFPKQKLHWNEFCTCGDKNYCGFDPTEVSTVERVNNPRQL